MIGFDVDVGDASLNGLDAGAGEGASHRREQSPVVDRPVVGCEDPAVDVGRQQRFQRSAFASVEAVGRETVSATQVSEPGECGAVARVVRDGQCPVPA